MSSSSSIWKFDVFVSFRGEDVRRNFASHLFCELDRMGINAFREDFDLERGKSISPELFDAIGGSRFAVVIVSENYATSNWCLDELVKIMECRDSIGQRVVPIFYGINPSDVRRQTGSVGEAMERHGDKEKVRNWKEALTKLAAISGEDSRNWMDESKLIRKIVRDISDQLVSTSSDDSDGLIVKSAEMDLLQSMISTEHEEVRMIGIWGMGGVGKTTIVRYLYNHLSCRFQAHCFMENVKEFCDRYGTTRLQEEFLSKMFGETDKGAWSSVLLSNIIKERFRHKTVLIVLDDVDKQEHLRALVKEADWFGPRSRIIITTRDKHLLDSHGVELVYKVRCLMKNEALQLFCHYAFRGKIIPSGFHDLSVRAVKYASGLPLALRVLGSFLYRRSEKEWKSTLDRLEIVPHSDVMEVLRVSYDGLDEQEKVIFLGISCFFNMKHVDYVSKLLDICGYAAEIGIAVLTEKSLLDISNGYIKMHDLVEQMGRELVRRQSIKNPGERLFLWDPKDISDMLVENSGTQLVEAVSLNMSEITDLFASDRAFEGLSNLKILNFYYSAHHGDTKVHLPTGLSYLPRKLRYLRWEGYPLKALPSRFHPEFLVELCMRHSHLEKLWTGTQSLLNLKKMDLSCCKYLVEVPDLSKATNLEELNLSYCQSLVEVPPSIQSLQRLSSLYMTNCSRLQHIPSRVILKSLEIVGLNGCTSLTHFPEVSPNGRRLYLNSTKIKELPFSISRLSCLIELDMSDCMSLRTLPSTVRDLVSLKSMNLQGCKHLGNLPRTLQELTSLETLEVSGSLHINEFPLVATSITAIRVTETSIEEVPGWICNLSRLRSLDLRESKRLKRLPVSISELLSLERLNLSGCSILESFPAEMCRTMSCLRWFDIGRTGITELPEDIGNLTALEVFEARKTDVRRAPLSIARLTRLHVLSIGHSCFNPSGQPSLCPRLPRFEELRVLRLSNLNMLEIPTSIGNLWSLSELDLSGNNFKMIPASIKGLSCLHRLNLNNCQRLRALPESPRCLLYIYAHGCTSLESISQCFRHCLHTLVVSNCFKLDQDAQLLIRRNMELDPEKPRFAYFPGRDVPSCFNHRATGPSLKIHLPPINHALDILGFSACVMVGMDVDGQYPMKDLAIRCRCHFRGGGAYDEELVVMDELWYPNPKAFKGMSAETDHLLLFSRSCTSLLQSYSEATFEFSLENLKGGSKVKPPGKIKKCAVHLTSFEDMVKGEEAAVLPEPEPEPPCILQDRLDMVSSGLELSEAMGQGSNTDQKEPEPKRIKLQVPSTRRL
ncbi:PREDICTED: disease resistance protein RML1B [Tarenaya hassleriana]|uniref:disease resistance protein RML1B n=1 Tax=Tarenaya hassleriana TaxID=28532 RepID=UPI00053C5D30|nr:PREDICTED: disease resistance protein RML1B [Tarenaya hassleriana]